MSESRWSISCLDTFGRGRAILVAVDKGQVLVMTPPGETATLSPEQAREFNEVLDKATSLAQGRAR